MARILAIREKTDSISKFVVSLLGATFFVFAIAMNFLRGISIQGISIDGYFRFAALILISIVFLTQVRRFRPVVAQERGLFFFIFSFMCLLLIQIGLLENKLLNLQGNVKLFFYFFVIFLGFQCCYYDPKNMRDALTRLAVLLFVSVAVFYPYLVYEFEFSYIERVYSASKKGFLLGAGNEDAHLIACFFPFVLVKLYGRRLATTVFIIFLGSILFFNGTRSAIISATGGILLFYILLSKRKLLYILLVASVAFIFMSGLTLIFSTIFESERGLLLNFADVLEGDFVGGNLSARITRLWIPPIEHTIRNSLWVGSGSNGWNGVLLQSSPYFLFVSGETGLAPHSFFVWTFVSFGILGQVIMLFIFYKIWKYSLFALKNSANHVDKMMSAAILCSALSFTVWCVIANAHGTHGWITLILLVLLSMANKYSILEKVEAKT